MSLVVNQPPFDRHVGIAQVSVEQHRSSQLDASGVRRRSTATPSSGTPSYTQPPQVSVMPYVRTTVTPASRARSSSDCGHGSPTDENRVELPERLGCVAVVDQPLQLCGDQGRVVRMLGLRHVHRRDSSGEPLRGEGLAKVDDRRVEPGSQRTHENLETADPGGGHAPAASAPGRPTPMREVG